MLFDRTLQAAMGLLDGVDKWAIWRQHDHVESIFQTQLRWNNDVGMWPRAVEDDEDFFINRYTWSQDDHQLTDESLEGGVCDRCLFDKVMNQTHVGDVASVMLTFLPRGATTRRTRSPNGARPLLLRLMMWHEQINVNTDLS